MIKSFAKYSCVALSLVIMTTSVSHATFFLNKDKHDDKDKHKISIFEPIKKIIDIKKDVISLLPEYSHPHTSTPHIPHTPPHIPSTPHNPHTPSTSISEPFALLATLTAMSAFLYRRRQNSF